MLYVISTQIAAAKKHCENFVSISELTVGVHIWSIINTHTCHLRLMLLSICELRYPESMDNIHMTKTSKSSTW